VLSLRLKKLVGRGILEAVAARDGRNREYPTSETAEPGCWSTTPAASACDWSSEPTDRSGRGEGAGRRARRCLGAGRRDREGPRLLDGASPVRVPRPDGPVDAKAHAARWPA
jgi:hypothetical protein